MHSSWERSFRGGKQGKHPKKPSFSSILLDEIFNSIDGNEQNLKEIKHFRNQSTRKTINGEADYLKVKTTSNRNKEGEEMASLKRACMMEKLMEKQINAKVSSVRKISSPPELNSIRTFSNFDQMSFSTSSSSSSDSSSGGHSSSDTELFYNASSRKSRTVTSCFSSKPLSKTIKSTANIPRPGRNNHKDSYNYKQSECYMFDDYYNPNQEMHGNESEDNVMKCKSRALRIYNNFKKVKQPISPGGRLSNFITSLFTSGNAKKSREEYERKGKPTKPSSTTASTCSSASSFSRSCLSKSVPNSKGKFDDFGARKTVHFYPVSVIVGEDSRPCGHKSIYNEDNEEFDGFRRRPRSYQSSETLKSHVLERKKKVDQEDALDVFHKGWNDQEKEDFDDEEVDRISNSSSDLFEIDHLGVFGNNRFCEELPVYETTHLDRNRAIASGLKF